MNDDQPSICAKRKRRYPVYLNHLPPCNKACPTGNNVQLWLQLVQQGKLREAWECIMQNNPMPAIHGRICYHYCETQCNRSQYDSSVNIHAIERFLGDMAIAKGWRIKAGENTDKKILVIGAGPAGLAVAYHLRLLGHAVTIYEKLPVAGGMMYVGIPAYRLPRDILAGEVENILSMGVNIEYNREVVDVEHERTVGNFDAVFLAVGAHLGKQLDIPVDSSKVILDATSYLRMVSLGNPIKTGKRLIVYGGGNTAIDVARTAIRLGVEDVNIVYRRSRQRMPAFDFEVEDALAEGVKFHYLRTMLRINGNEVAFCINIEDEKGAFYPTDKVATLSADAVIFALSQTPDVGFLRNLSGITINDDNTVNVDSNFMTGCHGVFAGGDMVPFERSVTVAAGQGKHIACYIDAFLNNKLYAKLSVNSEAGYDKLHINLDKTARVECGDVPVAERLSSFVEVTTGITDDQAILAEAARCFSCGNCFECDACHDVCPIEVIKKLGDGCGYSVNYDACVSCGKCYRQCPCGAIAMVEKA